MIYHTFQVGAILEPAMTQMRYPDPYDYVSCDCPSVASSQGAGEGGAPMFNVVRR